MSEIDGLRFRVFTMQGCPSCIKVKTLLDNLGVDYEVVDKSDPEQRQAFYNERKLVAEERRMPKVFEIEDDGSETMVGGYEATETYLAMLSAA